VKSIQRRILYGLLVGAATFVVGFGATLFALPADLYDLDVPSWHVAAWGYASAHFVPVAPPEVLAQLPGESSVDLLEQFPRYRYLRAVPPVVVGIGGGLVTLAVGGDRTPFHYLLNCTAVGLGYVPLAFLSVAETGGVPGNRLGITAGTILFLLLIGGAFLLTVTGDVRFKIPVFRPGYVAVTALSSVVGTVALAPSLWPVPAIAVAASLVGGGHVLAAIGLPE
jgi:hypothetical protein